MIKCRKAGCDGVVDETGFCDGCHLRPAAPSGTTGASIGQVPEEQRYCPNCMYPVGRGQAGRPGREHGFCMNCAAKFDFRPPMAVGDKIAQDRYRVEKILGAGGFGWAYLAQDDHLERPVVLKTLILDQVAGTVERERTVLTNLEHPNIVRIFDFVAHSPRCLVLDYVEGRPPAPDEPLDDILDYGHQILEALRYLHGKGFLHCDIKPANVLRVDGTVRLIDFGAVRKIDSTEPLGPRDPDYAPPPGDPDHRHPTEGFDLFCVGKTLGELCGRHLRQQDQTPGMESLLQLLDRAIDVKVPERRFFSAQRFAEQLRGVRRNLGYRSGEPVPSTIFAAMTDPLDGGLGMIPKLDHWLNNDIGRWPKAGAADTDADAKPPLPSPFTPPAATEVMAALPTILVDPAEASDPNVQERLSACRGALLLGNAEPADEALDEARLSPHDWRHSWYKALIALTAQDVRTAAGCFEQVRKALPGEIVPTLAQGLCEELQGHRAAATRHYENVVRVDGSLAAAGFGLARCRLEDGDRDQAIKAVDQVTERFGFDRVVRIARVRVPVAVLKHEGSVPGHGHLEEARVRLADLDITEPERAWLEAEIAYAALGSAGWTAPAPDQRRRLAQAIRILATQTPTQAVHTKMIDRANAIGPPIRFSW